MPNDSDAELKDLVSILHKHKHSVACGKTGKYCRFNFPKPNVDDIEVEKLIPLKQLNIRVLQVVHTKME